MISAQCSLGLSDDELSRWHDDDLSPARMTLIRTHIGACAACRERLDAFEAIGAGLRGLEPPPLDIARLLADLRDTTSSTAPPSASRATPARLLTNAPHRSRRMLTGVAGLAAVLVLSLLAGYLFTTYGPLRPSGTTSPANGLTIPADYLPMQATVISMSSRTDGWAFGSKSNNGDTPVIALHYSAGTWTRVQTVVKGRINALKMLSATDGWAAGDSLYHYDGHSWQEVRLPGKDSFSQYGAIDAVSPSAIWIAMINTLTPTVRHYDGHTWTWQNLPMMGSARYTLNSISMSSPNEGWAISQTWYSPTNDASANDLTPLGVLLHYTDGVWTVEKTYPNYMLMAVSMASASDGWIGGDHETDMKRNADGSSTGVSRPFLWRLTGGAWKDAPLPNPHGYSSPVGRVTNIQMLAPTEGWMIAGIDSATSAANPLSTVPPDDSPYYHLENGQWVTAPMPATLPSPANADVFAFVSSDEFWAMGGWGISHYYQGAWKNVVA